MKNLAYIAVGSILLAMLAVGLLFPLVVHPHTYGGSSRGASSSGKAASSRLVSMVRQGMFEVGSGRFSCGERLFRVALASGGARDGYGVYLADVLERQHKWSEALDAYHDVVEGRGKGGSVASDPNTLMRYVIVLARFKRWDEARTEYDRAVANLQRLQWPTVSVFTGSNVSDHDKMLACAHLVVGSYRPSYGWLYGSVSRFGGTARADRIAHLKAAVQLAPRWVEPRKALERELRTEEVRTSSGVE